MRKKIIKGLVLIVVVLAVYLALAHHHIYRVIGLGGLSAVDNRHKYVVNPLKTNNMIFASLGDSLTAGVGADVYEHSYPYLLAEKLAQSDRQVTNLNFSYPGARTEDLIRDLLPKAIAEQPDMVTLMIGVNDIHGGVSQTVFKKNYRLILSELKTKTKARVYVISIPTIGSETLLLPPYDIFFEQRTLSFNNDIKELAAEFGSAYLDLTTPTLAMSKKDGDYYAADKFHPSSVGYKIWANILYDLITK